ncbi:hypothetical protein DYB31_007937 [Aphanomyces astaci]|uniref:Uncharacterized protein n=1 Tax=Aphanomyces astaci TaxID=112090 RepID=A0A397F1K0_APHAT|nr:hypothetical protein DYB31_007937 [Aphanomyces astaci]
MPFDRGLGGSGLDSSNGATTTPISKAVGLMVVDGKNPSAHLHHPQRHHKELNQRPLHTQLPPAQVLAILSQHADAVKREEWTNNVQETVRDLISTILDQEKYSSLPDIQGQVEATTGIDMRSHLDWLQDTSKQKLKRINQAAEVIRVTAASTRVQRAFRARRWALRRRSRLRLEHPRMAADRVAQQAIQGYALDVVRRLVLRHVFLRRFRRLVQRLQREVVQQHALDIARRHMARYRVASWLRVSWPRYTLAKETHRRLTELEASVATMAQALVRGFLVRRRHICINNSAIHIQHVFRRYRLDKVQSAAATTLQTSSGRVPIRPPAKKPHTVPAATANPPETIQTLPPVRLVKRFERMCKTCHRHAHPHACEEMAVASSPVKKMVAVRTFGGRVTKATAMRAHELLLLGDKQRHHRHLQSQPPFVAKPPATNDSTKPLSLRKSLSLMRGIPTSNQEHHGVQRDS